MGNELGKDFWTKVLEEKGIESPGRAEAVRDAILISKQKREDKKSSSKKKK